MSCAPPAAVLFLTVLLWAPFPRSASAQDCVYQYLRQPPSSLADPGPACNPYLGIAELRVQCQVSVPSTEAAVVEILWFHNDQQITDSFPAMIELSPIETTGERSSITSTIVFDGDTFNDTYQGRYYCQIAVDGDNSIAPSNTLVLVEDSEFLSSCMRDQEYFSAEVVCVGTESPATTTTVVEETSLPPDTTDTTTAMTTATSATSPLVSTTLGSTALPDNSPPLQVWVYVLVAIAAVFGMIIVVLAILCVGLCLKKNKTEDTYKQKGVEMEHQFTSNSMVSNGLYQRKDDGGVTSGTHFSSHSQISDYNTLNHERDYEVIDMGGDKHDYHHLQRPSPPMLPSGRNFSFTPPKEFQSMNTLTSQMGSMAVSSDAFQHGKMSKNDSFLTKSTSVDTEEHVYRELEEVTPSSADSRTGLVKDIYRSPTASNSPDSAQLFSRGTFPSMPADSGVFGYPNESLYTPNQDSSNPSRIQQGGLENVPETGTMFCEPANPTAFPVHKYEKINEAPYETPVPTHAKTLTSPLTLVPTSQAGEIRPRTNSGARYETEIPQALVEDSQYSKLTRPHETLASFSIATAPLYSEMGPQELRRDHGADKGVFSRSTAELSKQDMAARRFSGRSEKGFTMPAHVGASGGGVVNRNSSISSATDSLASYAAQLQGLSGTSDMDGLLFNEQGSHSQGPAHESCKRNESLDLNAKNGNVPQNQKRAWSEERRETFSSGMNNRSGFSGSALDSRSLSSHGRSTGAPKMHREMRVNGIDLSLGDYARSKTMV